jgi:hypothetical protein
MESLMPDPFVGFNMPFDGPSPDLISIFPNDGADIPSAPAVGLYIETGGTLVFQTASGDVRSVTIPDNHTLRVGVRRVLATGTTAEGIHAHVFPINPALGLPSLFSAPEGLGWDEITWPLVVSRTAAGFDVGLTPRDLVDPLIWTGPAYHVDLVSGDDGNTGLGASDGDFSDPLRTIKGAFILGNATGAPYRVLVQTGTCEESAFTQNGNVEPSQPVAIIGWGGPVVYRTGPHSLIWTLDQGTTYATPLSSVNRVFRTDVLDGFGNYSELVEAADLAECRATIGTWFDNAGTIHVNIGSAPGTGDIAAIRNFHGARFLTHADDLYLEDIHTEGGISGALHCDATATRNVIAVDCSFRYSSPSSTASPLDAVQIRNTTGLVGFWRCNASYGAKDGFNFHEDVPGLMSALMVDCVSRFNGKWAASSVNALTTHEGVTLAVIGGEFGYSRDGAVGHFIDSSKVWIFEADLVARDDAARDATAAKCSQNAVLYLEGTTADAAGSVSQNLAIEANGGDVFKRRHTTVNGSELTSGAGTLQTF